jgi:hypothetical protein
VHWNEVGTTNRSVLNGSLEVFGQNAAVVIANPNGFDCNGCSFINTSAVISNLDKSVMILLSMVLTPAPFSVTMSLMLPACQS